MLDKWISHHAEIAEGRENLIIVSHGIDPRNEEIATGCSLIKIPFEPEDGNFEHKRRELFFGLNRSMIGYYQYVINLDCDEFITIDPRTKMDLFSYLESVKFSGRILSPAGVEIAHKPSEEPEPLDFDQPILRQRRHAILNGIYCKPCIFSDYPRVQAWTSHVVPDEPWHIDPNIVLFHLSAIDRDSSLEIWKNKQKSAEIFNKTHDRNTVGLWKFGTRRPNRLMKIVEDSEPSEWGNSDFHEYLAKIQNDYQNLGKMPWFEMGGAFLVPDRFIELL